MTRFQVDSGVLGPHLQGKVVRARFAYLGFKNVGPNSLGHKPTFLSPPPPGGGGGWLPITGRGGTGRTSICGF